MMLVRYAWYPATMCVAPGGVVVFLVLGRSDSCCKCNLKWAERRLSKRSSDSLPTTAKASPTCFRNHVVWALLGKDGINNKRVSTARCLNLKYTP
jgi:hypothetical protein